MGFIITTKEGYGLKNYLRRIIIAFTESTLNAQLDPAGTGKTISIERFILDTAASPLFVDVYAVPVNGYRGNSKWVKLTYSNNATQAAAQLQAELL